MSLSFIGNIRMREHLVANVRRLRFSEETDEEYSHPQDIIKNGVEIKVECTPFNECTMVKYFNKSICTTLTNLKTGTKCEEVILNAENIYIIRPSGDHHKVSQEEDFSLTCMGIPVISYDSYKRYDKHQRFTLEALYITHIL